jgi:hypothetical protein
VAPTAAEDFIARHAVAIEHVTGKSPAWCVRSRGSVHTVHAAFNYAETHPALPLPYPAPALPHRTTRTPLYIQYAYAGLPRTGGESTLALYSCILFAHCGTHILPHRNRGGDGSDAQHCAAEGGRFEADNPAHPYSSTSLKLRERLRGHPAIEDRIERWYITTIPLPSCARVFRLPG